MKIMNQHEECFKWMFYHCPKKDSWIVAKHLDDILEETDYRPNPNHPGYNKKKKMKPDLKAVDIRYVHAIHMTEDRLICLLETQTAYYIIDNRRHPERIDSKTVRCHSLAEVVNNGLSDEQRALLKMKRLHEMKLSPEEENKMSVYPHQYARVGGHDELMKMQLDESGHLDLSWNFSVTADVLEKWVPDREVKAITFNSCYQINHFKWTESAWVAGLEKISLINMTSLTNDNLGFIASKLSGLKQMGVHFCPQVNIRCLLGVLKNRSLEVLMLDDPKLVCQPNQYGGLITEEEWSMLINASLKKLLITSTTMSLDIIDYLRVSCQKLEMLIIDHNKYEELKKNLVVVEEPGIPKIYIASVNGVKLELPRTFGINNLMRHRYQKPFSDAMMKIMEKVYQEEEEERKAEEERTKDDVVEVCSLRENNLAE